MRYKAVLEAKIEKEQVEEAAQEKIKEKNGILDSSVAVKKRSGKQMATSIMLSFLNLFRYMFAAVGVLVMIEPSLREQFFVALSGIWH